MFGLFSKSVDFEALGLELIQHAVQYQTPTVDGIFEFLDQTGQLRLDTEIQEKKILNVAAAAVSAELFVTDLGGDIIKTDRLLYVLYSRVEELSAMTSQDVADRVRGNKRVVREGIKRAIRSFPDRGSDGTPHKEVFAFEIARVIIEFYGALVGFDYEPTLPNARADGKTLSLSASGIARVDRWLVQSLDKKMRRSLQ